jgi:hypothetical protein
VVSKIKENLDSAVSELSQKPTPAHLSYVYLLYSSTQYCKTTALLCKYKYCTRSRTRSPGARKAIHTTVHLMTPLQTAVEQSGKDHEYVDP